MQRGQPIAKQHGHFPSMNHTHTTRSRKSRIERLALASDTPLANENKLRDRQLIANVRLKTCQGGKKHTNQKTQKKKKQNKKPQSVDVNPDASISHEDLWTSLT